MSHNLFGNRLGRPVWWNWLMYLFDHQCFASWSMSFWEHRPSLMSLIYCDLMILRDRFHQGRSGPPPRQTAAREECSCAPYWEDRCSRAWFRPIAHGGWPYRRLDWGERCSYLARVFRTENIPCIFYIPFPAPSKDLRFLFVWPCFERPPLGLGQRGACGTQVTRCLGFMRNRPMTIGPRDGAGLILLVVRFVGDGNGKCNSLFVSVLACGLCPFWNIGLSLYRWFIAV